jgi:hypothetical protein
MSNEESCCDVRVGHGTIRAKDGHQYDWEHVYCLTCGAGQMRIDEPGLPLSFITTAKKCINSDVLGEVPLGERTLASISRLILLDTPAQPGSCKPASTHGKPPATLE